MRMANRKCQLGLVLWISAGLLSACSTVAPFGRDRNFELAEDEKRIWSRSQEEAKRLDESGQLYGSRETVEYVNEVAQKLLPEALRERKEFDIRVRIIKNPLLNAFALSHGAIYIHTGMLAKLENEAQLATILAHEITHITHRHPVQHFRTIQNVSTAMAVLQMAALPAGHFGGLVGLLGAIGATAAVSGYSRSFEAEADANGLELTIDAGYDPSEAPKLFEYLQKELSDRKIEEPFFFGSHPKLQDRKENYDALIAKKFAGKTGRLVKGQYEEMINPLLLDNAEMDLALGRWSWAEEAIRRSIASRPDDPTGYHYLGKLFRRRADSGDHEKAEGSYRSAIERDESYAAPRRGLGLIYLKQGNAAKALVEFQNYLTLAPNAADRAYVEQYISNSITGERR